MNHIFNALVYVAELLSPLSIGYVLFELVVGGYRSAWNFIRLPLMSYSNDHEKTIAVLSLFITTFVGAHVYPEPLPLFVTWLAFLLFMPLSLLKLRDTKIRNLGWIVYNIGMMLWIVFLACITVSIVAEPTTLNLLFVTIAIIACILTYVVVEVIANERVRTPKFHTSQ